MTSPCCGCSLQTGTKILAIIGIICQLLILGISFGAIAIGKISPEEDDDLMSSRNAARVPLPDFLHPTMTPKVRLPPRTFRGMQVEKPRYTDKEIYFAYFISLRVGALILDVILLIGAMQRKISKVKLWFFLTCGISVLVTGSMIYSLQQGGSPNSAESEIISILFNIYGLLLVFSFIEELQQETFLV